jgi:hypothetical protein
MAEAAAKRMGVNAHQLRVVEVRKRMNSILRANQKVVDRIAERLLSVGFVRAAL